MVLTRRMTHFFVSCQFLDLICTVPAQRRLFLVRAQVILRQRNNYTGTSHVLIMGYVLYRTAFVRNYSLHWYKFCTETSLYEPAPVLVHNLCQAVSYEFTSYTGIYFCTVPFFVWDRIPQ